MKVFIIGGAGKIGRELSRLLAERGECPSGMYRNPDQEIVVRGSGAEPVLGDLITDSVHELAARMAGHDAIVFSAGAHGTGMEQTTLIDGQGLEKSVAAAHKAGIERFVLVSALPEAGRDRPRSESFEHYMKVKKHADVHVAASGLDWVIIRPGTLTDDPMDGQVSASLALDYGTVRRGNVAALIDLVLHTSRLSHAIIEVTDGPTPVGVAVRDLETLLGR